MPNPILTVAPPPTCRVAVLEDRVGGALQYNAPSIVQQGCMAHVVYQSRQMKVLKAADPAYQQQGIKIFSVSNG